MDRYNVFADDGYVFVQDGADGSVVLSFQSEYPMGDICSLTNILNQAFQEGYRLGRFPLTFDANAGKVRP